MKQRCLARRCVAILVAMIGVVLLAACAPRVAEPGTIVAAPQLDDHHFIASDGYKMPVRQWSPENPDQPRAVVLAAHGFNDYSKAFDKVPGALGAGPFLASKGYLVFAYDQRGFGRSDNAGLWPGDEALVADYSAFARVLRARYPHVPLYGLGESMGGAVVLTALASSRPPPLDGAILVAPAVWARSTMPWYYRMALWIGAHVLPSYRPTGKSLGRQASDNIDMLRDLGRDPYFIKKTRLDSVFGLVNLMDDALYASARQKVPMLYLYGSRDEIIPPKASAEAMGHVLTANPNARAAFYDASWHMMLRDRAGPVVLEDMAAFLADPKGPLPSAADANALERLQIRAKKPWVPKVEP